MNEKDKEMHRIIDAVIECCTTTLGEDVYSVNKEDVLGKCKRENANITRDIGSVMLLFFVHNFVYSM